MPNPKKVAKVKEIETKLKQVSVGILTEFRGLNVQQLDSLRKQLREQEAEYKIYKNSLLKRAVAEVGLTDLVPYLEGPTAIALGKNDPTALAKVLSNYAKENKQLVIKGGVVEGKVFDAALIKSLAALPSREVLLAQLLGGLQAPITGLVNVLSGPLRGLAVALKQISEQKERS